MLAHETLVTSWRQLREWLEKRPPSSSSSTIRSGCASGSRKTATRPACCGAIRLRRLRQLRKIDEPILNRQQEDFPGWPAKLAERRELIPPGRLSGTLLVLLIGQVIGLLALVYQVSEKQAQQKSAAKEQERRERSKEARARLAGATSENSLAATAQPLWWRSPAARSRRWA